MSSEIIFATLLSSLPNTLVWIVGLILSLIFWKRYPTVCLITLIAMIGFIIAGFVGSYLNSWLPLRWHQMEIPTRQITSYLVIKGIVTTVISMGLWGLVIAAIFTGRKQIHPYPELPRT